MRTVWPAPWRRLDEHPVDLVLLDLGLPDSRGMESVVALQRHAPYVPIIVLSGLDDENTATCAVQKGVQDYLIKGQVDSTLAGPFDSLCPGTEEGRT